MTMVFSTDNADDHLTAKIRLNNNDLHLENVLRAAASTTVKFLHKRNANSQAHAHAHTNTNTVDDYNQDGNVINADEEDNDVLFNTEYITTGAKNLSDTVTTIWSNVSKVLYTYLQNQTSANDAQAEHSEHVRRSGNNDMPQLTQLSTYKSTLAAAASSNLTRIAATMKTSEILSSSTYNSSSSSSNSSILNHIAHATTEAAASMNTVDDSDLNESNNNVITATMTHLNEFLNAATATTPSSNATLATTAMETIATNTTIKTSTTYPSIAINSYENCSAIFANYTKPQQGVFCNWVWDKYLCWPPTPAGVLARMNCPSGYHGVDAKNSSSTFILKSFTHYHHHHH